MDGFNLFISCSFGQVSLCSPPKNDRFWCKKSNICDRLTARCPRSKLFKNKDVVVWGVLKQTTFYLDGPESGVVSGSRTMMAESQSTNLHGYFRTLTSISRMLGNDFAKRKAPPRACYVVFFPEEISGGWKKNGTEIFSG